MYFPIHIAAWRTLLSKMKPLHIWMCFTHPMTSSWIIKILLSDIDKISETGFDFIIPIILKRQSLCHCKRPLKLHPEIEPCFAHTKMKQKENFKNTSWQHYSRKSLVGSASNILHVVAFRSLASTTAISPPLSPPKRKQELLFGILSNLEKRSRELD